MGTSQRNDLAKSTLNKSPGPGAYSQDQYVKVTGKGTATTPSFSFSHNKRISMDKLKPKDLGPGSYESKSFIADGPAFSARIRNESI